MQPCEFTIPGSFPSVANLREHWAARARRAKKHRAEANLLAKANVPYSRVARILDHGGTVTLTRYAPRKLDSDNLAGALKATRDGIAAALGVDDGDERVVWLYSQRPCKNGEQRVLAVVESGPGREGR